MFPPPIDILWCFTAVQTHRFIMLKQGVLGGWLWNEIRYILRSPSNNVVVFRFGGGSNYISLFYYISGFLKEYDCFVHKFSFANSFSSFWVFSFQRISRIGSQVWMIHSFSFWVPLLNCSLFYTQTYHNRRKYQNNMRIIKWWKIVIFKRTLPLIPGVNKASESFVVVSHCEFNSLFIDIRKTLFICTR